MGEKRGSQAARLPPRWFVVSFWHAHRALRRGVKPVAFTTMGLTVGASLWWGGLPIAAKIGVLSCALIGVAVVARLPVINED